MAKTPAGRPLTPAGRRVLEVASDLFYRRGIHTVGMDLIAESAGVTKKTIYDRFGSKESLVVAYLEARDERWRRWLTDRLAAADDPRQRILLSFEALDEWMARENPRGCAFGNAYAELSDPRHPARAVAQAQKTWLLGRYAELAREAGVADPEPLADALLVLHEGAVVARNVAGRQHAAATARHAAEQLLGAASARSS
ncbi:MAG: TetR family transcriptional regulator [Micromonosporaceae bacterium]|nr:TetR family transcriptional regulator [Micromonosporaceae bacterium]